MDQQKLPQSPRKAAFAVYIDAVPDPETKVMQELALTGHKLKGSVALSLWLKKDQGWELVYKPRVINGQPEVENLLIFLGWIEKRPAALAKRFPYLHKLEVMEFLTRLQDGVKFLRDTRDTIVDDRGLWSESSRAPK